MAREFKWLVCLIAALGLLIGSERNAAAEDTLKVAIGQRGSWDTSVSELGQRAGIFKKHGLVLDILYTQGAGETQQSVISGSVDVGVAAGIMGVLSAFSKGAPVRVIGSETAGAGDLFWYVRADSPIKSLKDTDGKTIAYSTNGSSTHGVVTALIKEYNLKAKPVATGGQPSTLTQVMSGQIDVGWSSAPFGLDLLDQGKIRIVARGSESTAFRQQSVRLLVTNVQTLQTRKDAIDRYIRAYRETVDWMYTSNEAPKLFAEFVGISEDMAKRPREFLTKESLDPDNLVGLDVVMPDAVELKYISAPLTKEQLAQLIQIPAK